MGMALRRMVGLVTNLGRAEIVVRERVKWETSVTSLVTPVITPRSPLTRVMNSEDDLGAWAKEPYDCQARVGRAVGHGQLINLGVIPRAALAFGAPMVVHYEEISNGSAFALGIDCDDAWIL